MDFPNIPRGEIISLDYETTGLRYWLPDFRVFGIGVAAGDPASRMDSWYFDIRDQPRARDWLADLLPGRKVVAQNAQYEYQCTRVLKIDPRSVDWYCTMVNECLIDEHHLTYDLASIARHRGIDSEKTAIL